MIKQLSIIGVGLIGGSLALALKRAGYCQRIIGIGRDPARLQQAQQAGIIDEYSTDYATGLELADVLLLAVPLNSYLSIFQQIKPHIQPQTVITDVGSAKASVLADAQQVFGEPPSQFVPGHPIAGNEKSGFAAAMADLFQQRRVVLTPLPTTDAAAIDCVTQLWTAAGAMVDILDVLEHDRILALTSHLPHMLAFGLVDALAGAPEADAVFRLAAGGFRDFTRIAASDPVMWRDIALRNRDAILQALDTYQTSLLALRSAIDDQDGAALLDIMQRAKQARETFCY